jgi:hypothetical protein
MKVLLESIESIERGVEYATKVRRCRLTLSTPR